MKKKPSKNLEKCRITTGVLGSNSAYGNNGCFQIPYKKGIVLNVIVSDEMGWDHVSVSLPTITPTWLMMNFVKDLFWDEEECVMQLHPPKSDYINQHSHCLHLWKPQGAEIPLPPSIMVGV